jgi:hypothetical protein
VHLDGVECVLGYITTTGDDHRQGFPYVPHLLMGEGIL